jgi:hypothetical protein
MPGSNNQVAALLQSRTQQNSAFPYNTQAYAAQQVGSNFVANIM